MASELPIHSRSRVAQACSVVALVWSASASADEFDALNVLVGGSITHYSNLFRGPDFVDPKSETIRTGYVGLRIDKPYAQQRFQLDVIEKAYRYDNFSYLDFNGLAYRGAWLWHLSPRISGTLSADRTESPTVFEETFSRQSNVRLSENRLFDLDAWIFGGWHGLLGVSQSKQTSERTSFQAIPDFRSDSILAGGKYVAQTGSWASFIYRSTQGHYLDSPVSRLTSSNDAFRQDEIELSARGVVTSRSTVNGRIAWIERRNETFTQGDFSGVEGNFGYLWTPTAKLNFDFQARRDLDAYQDVSAAYRVNNVLSVAPVWQVSGKVAVRMEFEYMRSYFRGGVDIAGLPSRSDTTYTTMLGADWSPLRSFLLGARLQRQERSSNVALFEYDDTTVGVNASLMF